jgi:hypothetical protein
MKNQAKLMKSKHPSDIGSMVRDSMNSALVRPAMPVSTAAMWGMPAVRIADGTEVSSAIWGTSAMLAHMQQAPRQLPSIVRSS